MRDDVTVVIPIGRHELEQEQRREWLQQAIGSFPKGTPYLVVENEGEMAQAVNEGVRNAQTEFCFLMGSDDMLASGALDFLVSLCWDVDVTYPSLVHCSERMEKINVSPAPLYCPNRLQVWNYIPGGACVRRQSFLKAGGFRELRMLEDWDCWVRMMRLGARFKAVPEAMYYYRHREGSRNLIEKPDQEGFRERWWSEIVGRHPDWQATFIYQATYATAYHRCLVPGRYLGPCWNWEGFPHHVEDDRLVFPELRGSLVLQFPGDSGRAALMLEAQEAGHKVFVEVDDTYLEFGPYRSGWVKKMSDRTSPHSHEGHALITSQADGLIATTDILARRYKDIAKQTFVVPNQIEPLDWEIPRKPDDGILRIGWFASPSHRDDAKLIGAALDWASKQPDVEVITMGCDPRWSFKRTHLPWSNDMAVYRKLLQQLDIGLAPIVETPWSSCKSDLKALEYAMAGVCPVLSTAPPYKDWHNYVGCLKAGRAAEWTRAIRQLVRERQLVKELAYDARQYVLKHRLIKDNIWRWEEAFNA